VAAEVSAACTGSGDDVGSQTQLVAGVGENLVRTTITGRKRQ
jgi:hypothetical protein